MNEKTFIQGIKTLTTSYPARFGEMDDTDLNVWFKLLEHLTDAEFENAVIFHCQQYLKPPNPASIIQTVKTLSRIHLSAEDVLQKVVELARAGTEVRDLKNHFDGDSAALKAIDSVGWDRIRFEPSKTWPFLERRFLEAYRGFRESTELGTAAEFLPHDRIKMIQDRITDAKKIGQLPAADDDGGKE